MMATAVGQSLKSRSRASSKLLTQYDADGKEVVIETREDEEQGVKLQETIDLLLAAGYFRARIKGLSPFDKVVGGMVWCIETSNYDIDVDLLFQENLTIGQKISLTEKIVAVLPKMKCPRRIEPHQIQGLDFIHIFPVVQWLVKKAIEIRQETGDLIRAFSLSQFNKTMKTPEDFEFEEDKENAMNSLNSVNEVYQPQRRFRRNAALKLRDESSRVQSTLLEYGRGYSSSVSSTQHDTQASSQPDSQSKETEANEQKRIKSLMSGMSAMQQEEIKLSASTVGNIVGMQSEQIQQIASNYADKQAQLAAEVDNAEKVGGIQSHKRAMMSLKKQLENKTKTLDEAQNKHSELKEQLAKTKQHQEEVEKLSEQVKQEMDQYDGMINDDNEDMLLKLRDLVSMNENLKQQELDFKQHCHEELSRLKKNVAELENASDEKSEDNEQRHLIIKQYEADSGKLSKIRLLLAKKNREIVIFQRKIDEVPTRAELGQYQRRFIELYNQVAAKHKETKQFYTLYNTLDDTKLYYNKEINLLNSILDNFNEAKSSPNLMDQFLKQFENIVEGMRQNKVKVEKKKQIEKAKRDELNDQHLNLIDKQRLYFKTVKDFKQECHKNEILMSKLKSQGQ